MLGTIQKNEIKGPRSRNARNKLKKIRRFSVSL